MSKYKFDLSRGILLTAAMGLMCVGLDAILALWISVIGGVLLWAGISVTTTVLGLVGLAVVLLMIIGYSFTKEEDKWNS